MKAFQDQLKRKIKINFPPKRIISLVPSQTELLYDLGLDNEIIGITRYCIHPKEKFEKKIKVGGTKNVRLEKIRALKPDIIIANKEENSQEDIEALMKEFPVWISDIYTLKDSYKMISDIGKLCGKEKKANEIVHAIQKSTKLIQAKKKNLSVAYLIWKGPLMSINKNTFINNMLKQAGFKNVFKNIENRYPEISDEDIKKANPDYIFLSSEPYPFKEKHIEYFKKQFPNSKTILVDGELFSWYGSRLLKFHNYFEKELSNL